MNYKSYANTVTVSSRMARKHLRQEVFVANKKMRKAARKAARLERKSQELE